MFILVTCFLPLAAKRPRIAVHPTSTLVIYGRCLNLSIQVDPTEPKIALQYQWYRNGKPLGGKTTPNISISSATEGDVGEYYCVVSNQSAKTVSNVARVEVVNPHLTPAPPMSLTQPLIPAAGSALVNPSTASGYQTQWGYEGRYTTNHRATAEPRRHDNLPPSVGGDLISRGVSTGGGHAPVALAEEDQPSGQPVGQEKPSAAIGGREKGN